MEKRRAGETLIFPCAGASHCGQVAYRSAIELTERKVGQAFSVAAIGSGTGEKLDRARRAGRRVAIDGCEEHCVRKVMLRARLPVDLHIVVTEFGIERLPDRPALIRDSRMIVEQTRLALPSGTTGS